MAAEQGNASAQSNLGAMYNNGEGVPQDYVQAFKWVRVADEQGIAAAQYELGEMYSNEERIGVVKKNYIEAHKWFNLADSRSSSSSYLARDGAIAIIEEKGPDTDTGFSISVQLGHESPASFKRRNLESSRGREMTQKEITTAQRLAREWQPKTWDQIKAE